MLGRLPRGCAVLVGAWLVVVVVLVLCGEGVKHSAVITSADRRITTFAVTHRTPALNDIMKVVTWTGSWIAVAVVGVAVGVLTWRRRLRLLALGAVLASWVGELLGATPVKRLVERDRPRRPCGRRLLTAGPSLRVILRTRLSCSPRRRRWWRDSLLTGLSACCAGRPETQAGAHAGSDEF
jgi:hypothetical protein